MDNKYKKFYVEWWRIRKSTIYWLVALGIITALASGFLWFASRNDWFAKGGPSEMPLNAARIISYEGEIRITRAATRETILITKETYVAAGDTIQTQSDGRAIVQMIDGSVYTVRPNSTIVVRDNSSIFGGMNVRVALDDGQINVRTEEQPENAENVVEMLDSETTLRSQTDASFNTDSRQAEIRISRGSVETTVGGERATIGENEFAALNEGRLKGKEQLLRPPLQTSPANQSQISASGKDVTVSFTWENAGGEALSGYHIQVARSPYFSTDTILVDRSSLTSRSQRLSGLTPGTYYWRLKAAARSGQISEWSEPWKLTVVRRGLSSDIAVSEWKADNVGGNIFMVSGKTQPGLVVKAQGRETFVGADGSFRLQISTPLSEIAVEFVDDTGARAGYVLSLRSSKVLRRF